MSAEVRGSSNDKEWLLFQISQAEEIPSIQDSSLLLGCFLANVNLEPRNIIPMR
jgi:hypothetical protein